MVLPRLVCWRSLGHAAVGATTPCSRCQVRSTTTSNWPRIKTRYQGREAVSGLQPLPTKITQDTAHDDMFNALNRIISRLDGDAPSTTKDNHGAFGFQVLRNQNPELAVEPWFDFVVGINGRMIVRPCPPPSALAART